MADIRNVVGPSGCDGCNDDGCDCRGKRGKRGKTGPTGPTGPGSGGLPTIAAALVDGVGGSPTEGFLSNNGFSSYTRLGPGQYQLGLAGVPPPDINCIVNVTSSTVFLIPVNESAFMSGGSVIVTFQQGLTPIDATFNITVTDNR